MLGAIQSDSAGPGTGPGRGKKYHIALREGKRGEVVEERRGEKGKGLEGVGGKGEGSRGTSGD